MKLETKKLPLYGVGPFYGLGITFLTIAGIVMTKYPFADLGRIKGWPLITLFIIIGITLFVEGFLLWYTAFIGKNKIANYIDSSKLCTGGPYSIVRNPCYSGAMFMCTGALFLGRNIFLLLLPILFWSIMTIMLIFTEEKWLEEVYGTDYLDYKKRVNRCVPWFQKKTKQRLIANIFAIVIACCLVLFVAGGYIVNLYFAVRYEADEFWSMRTEYFDDLSREEHKFRSNKGQLLAGYLYKGACENQRGVIVLAHGYGGNGHTDYMPYINEFVQNGYYVFAYDATGYGESEGDSMIGLPQQIIDMDYAINYVESLDTTKSLPLMLWGHSWGGYTVTNELKRHPEVKACIVNAGFNKSSDLIKSWGLDIVGPATYPLMPFIELYEYMIFGQVSKSEAMDALANCDTKVLFYTCHTDTVVPPKYGFYLWEKALGASDRFTFRLIEDHLEKDRHSQMFCSKEYLNWRDSFDEESGYNDWYESLDYDYKKEPERFTKEKQEFIEPRLDRKIWANRADKDLFAEMIEFYDSTL